LDDRDEEARLLGIAGEPLRTIILVAIYTGMRMAVEMLTFGMGKTVDLERGYMTVRGAYFQKRMRTATIPLTREGPKRPQGDSG